MTAAQLLSLLKSGGILIPALLVCATAQASNEEISFERCLHPKSVTVAPDSDRSNLCVAANAEEMPDNNRNATLLEVARRLNEAGLLTESSYGTVLQEIERGIIQRRSRLLSKLIDQASPHAYTAVARLELSAEPDLTSLEGDLGLASDDVSEIQHVIEQLDSDLEQLNSTGVLSASTYEYLTGEVASGRVFDKLQLYQMAKEKLAREESVDPNLLKPRLDALRTADILSEQGYASLLGALEAAELQNPIEFLTYIEQAQMFDLTNYPIEPASYFPAIYQSVAHMLSQTDIVNGDISEFELELIPDQEMNQIYDLLLEAKPDRDERTTDEWRAYDALVSVQIDDRHYEQTSFHSPSSDEQTFLGRIESEGIVNLFNKVLRDQASPYRLFSISSFDPHVDYSRFGFIALTEAQADVYWRGSWHGADYTSALTSDRIVEIVALLSDIKLLDHLSEDEISEGKKQIARQYITHSHQLLSAFKDVVLLFDWESAEGNTPYLYLLDSLSDISHGAFNPTDIEDAFDWESQTAGIAFTLNGNRYSTELEFNSDWLDPEFFKFVESVAATEALTGQFYPLSEDEYGVEGYIFLNDMQIQALRSQQVVTTLPLK